MNSYIRKICRIFIILKKRCKLKNKEMTIISSNCIAGVLYKELGCKFYSPTINLFFLPNEFIKFVNNLDYYLSQELSFDYNEEESFPIGILGDIKIYFMHYTSQKEAYDKWMERCKRINKDNLYIIMLEKDGCTKKDIDEFENLPYKNKVIFTHKQYDEYEYTYYIPGFEKENELGNIIEFKNNFGKRYYDSFKFVEWFNEKEII